MAAKIKEEPKPIEAEIIRVPNNSFYANEFTVHMGKDTILDFKVISPRFDRTQVSEITEHNTIIMDITLFKNLIVFGSRIIEEFEKKYGEIKPSDYIQQFNEDSINQLKELQAKLEKDVNSADYVG